MFPNSTLFVTFLFLCVLTKPSVPANCKGGGVVELDLFDFHPKDKFNVSDHDYGDIPGDTSFGCGDFCPSCPPPTHGGNSLITHIVVLVNSSWGPYAKCEDASPGSCEGGDGSSVGRELPNHSSPVLQFSQCSNVSLAGQWFSLEEGGRCGEGKKVGDDGCTWSLVEVKRTISVFCLLEKGFTDACQEVEYVALPGEDIKLPYYPAANKVFETAIYNNETVAGGCPDVDLPTYNYF